MKLVGIIGKLLKIDRVIFMKELFSYVRILVKIFIDEEFFKCLSFENEWG